MLLLKLYAVVSYYFSNLVSTIVTFDMYFYQI